MPLMAAQHCLVAKLRAGKRRAGCRGHQASPHALVRHHLLRTRGVMREANFGRVQGGKKQRSSVRGPPS